MLEFRVIDANGYDFYSECFRDLEAHCYLKIKKALNSFLYLCIVSCHKLSNMIRFLLLFCSPFFLVICDEKLNLNKDHDFSKAVQEIISGERKGQDIPNDLKIVSEFYENPKPELFSKQEISLTCLGKKKNFT